MSSPRWRFVCLWWSQVARVTADNALRFLACIEYARRGVEENNGAWHLATALFVWPAIVLAPLNGAICNSLPKSRVLKASALFGCAVTGVFCLLNDHLLWCWGLIAIGSAIYGPTRNAMLPAASEDAHWPLTRINGAIETGIAGAIIAGLVLLPGCELLLEGNYDTSVALRVIFLLNALALLAALPVGFPSDVRRDDAPLQALRGFFVDCRTIWNEREARISLLGLSGLRGLIIGITGALLPHVLDDENFLGKIAAVAGWVAAGSAAGALLAATQKHPRRALGFVPWGALGMTLGLFRAANDDFPGNELCAFFGGMAGLISVPLFCTYQIALPPDARGNGMAIRNLTDYVLTVVIALVMFVCTSFLGVTNVTVWLLLAASSALATLAAWWIFRREVVEQIIEVVFAVMYRFRIVGPGVDHFPLRGPVVVVANHSSWLDPMWLAKALPRSVTPMMTSVFFDQPLLRFIMIYLIDAIRVEASGFRRDVPELRAAVAALDTGKCLVIFPEGRLRRTEEQPLKWFGQGVWHILRDRPNTPVVVCWIEGGWGSFFSYCQGAPTKNKRIDIARPIGISVGKPQMLDAEILADQRKTRQYLMEQCLQARQQLGLEPFALEPVDAESAKEQ